MKNKLYLLALTLLAITLVTCKKKETQTDADPVAETPVPTENYIKLSETYLIGAKAKAVIYAEKALETGYNPIYVALYDSVDGSKLSNGHFDIEPIMNMGATLHGAPVENSEDSTSTNGYFKSAVVFSMAGTASQWGLHLDFHNHKNELHGSGSIGVEVKASTPSKFISTILVPDSNANIYISLITPKAPKVGINDFEIVLHKKQTDLDFPFSNKYTIEIEPNMPSMGHGSPNNVNPVHTAMGHYLGKVNFTMTGLWQVKLKIYKNGTLVSSDTFFEMTIQE